MEALVSRLKEALKVPDVILEENDLLDPNQAERRKKVRRGKKKKRQEASLNAIGDSLLFYQARLGLADAGTPVKALVDCGASRTFLSTGVANRLGLGVLSRRKFDPLRVKILDSSYIYTNKSVYIPVAIGT